MKNGRRNLLKLLFFATVFSLAVASASAQAVLLESTPSLKSSVGASGALLLTHSHTLGNIKEEVLAES